MFEKQKSIIEEMFPATIVRNDGYWGTPRIYIGDLMIWLDQNMAAISFVSRFPDGFDPQRSSDGPTAYRIVVAADGTMAVNVYGLLYSEESLPDLLAAAREIGAIEIARSLYNVKGPENHKWFSATTLGTPLQNKYTPEVSAEILALRRLLRESNCQSF